MEKSALAAFLPLVLLGFVLLAWSCCLPAALTWQHNGADGGDWATAALRRTLPHPPGAPLYHLLTRLVVRLPLDPARSLSALSAGMAGLSAALLSAALLSEGASLAWGAGLLLAAAPAFASQALIVEVYTTAALIMALLVYLVRRSAPPWLIGLGWGLGLGVHLTLALAGFWLVLTLDSRRARVTLLSVAAWVALLIYALLVPYLGRGAPSPWADMTTLRGWWAYVSAELYHGYVFSLPWSAWPQRLLASLGWWIRQWTPLAALGLLGGWRRSLSSAEKGAWLSLVAISLYMMGYNVSDAWVQGIAFLPLSFWLAVRGWSTWLRDRGHWLWVLVPLLAWALTMPGLCLHGADEAWRWAEATLRQAPPQALLCTHADGDTFALWYAQARGLRPDVRVVDVDLLAYAPYRRYLSLAEEGALSGCQDVYGMGGP